MKSTLVDKILLAPWLLPVYRDPIKNGAVAVERGKIVKAGPEKIIRREFKGIEQNFPRCVLMPALVNAHVHLELSGLRGQAPGDGNFVSWVERLIYLRKNVGAGLNPAVGGTPTEDITDGIEEAVKTGTGLIGEISNTARSYPLLAKSNLHATFFLEVLSFQQEKAVAVFESAKAILKNLTPYPHIIRTLAPHAPNTVSPELFSLIKDFLAAYRLPSSFHLGESPEEAELLLTGKGPLKDFMERMNAWEPKWQPPATTPAAYWQALNPPSKMMLVHLTQAKEPDIKLLAQNQASVCLCPRSNAHIGVGRPDLETMLAQGLKPALGTDSLASNEDLNLFKEMAYVRKNFKIPGSIILKMATLWGARALGWGKNLGSLDAGKTAKIIAVEIEKENPEEALLTGVESKQVSWVEN